LSAFLLDVNVLISLFWSAHVHHGAAQKWFAARSAKGWATTPLTQAAFVCIVSNPAFSKDAVAPSVALELLTHNLNHPHHRFWPANLPLGQALAELKPKLSGHQQVTDAYLLGLVRHFKGRLATFDTAIMSLLDRGDEKWLELIPSS
jgi:toxin-antitoxin system PIN domain toxin